MLRLGPHTTGRRTRANAEARIPARGRHRGVDKTLLRPPTDPGATGLIPVVGSHAGLDRTIPGAIVRGDPSASRR